MQLDLAAASLGKGLAGSEHAVWARAWQALSSLGKGLAGSGRHAHLVRRGDEDLVGHGDTDGEPCPEGEGACGLGQGQLVGDGVEEACRREDTEVPERCGDTRGSGDVEQT